MTKRYQLGGTEWKYDRLDLYECDHVPFCLSEEQLLLMGATPLADKPEDDGLEPLREYAKLCQEDKPEAECDDEASDPIKRIIERTDEITMGELGKELYRQNNPQPVREIEPIDIAANYPTWGQTCFRTDKKLNQLINSHNQLKKVVNSLKGQK
jgi:hypothetical protein